MRQTYHIDRLGHQGDGIAPGPFFAPLTLPGEVISAVADGDRLGDIRIETPSDHRVAPPCSHFRACGGCQLMHGSDAFMADWKVGVVVQALAARGITAQVAGLHTSPARSRRRAGLSARRTKKGALAGFHARGSDTIIEVPKCQLLDPALLPALEVAQDLAMTGGSRKGELAVMATATLSGLDISVSGGKPLSRELETDLAAIAEARDLARLAWDGEVVALRRPPYHRFGKALVAPPPGAFLQATMDGEAALRSAVTQIIGDAAQVVDLRGLGISNIYGETGNLVIARGTVIEEYRAGSGNDTVTGNGAANTLLGNGGNDILRGGLGNDTLNGGAGNDILNGGSLSLSRSDGADAFIGGAGIDTVTYEGSAGSLRVDMIYTSASTFSATGDTFDSIENLIGSQGKDNLRGTQEDNVITGNSNVDYIYGRRGDDTLNGGVGDDVLFGGVGADTLNGGIHRDRAQYSQSLTELTLDLLDASRNTGEGAGDVYNSIEDLAGSEYDDQIFGNNGANRLFGRGGDDRLTGRSGDDYLNGGGGRDTLLGGIGNDVLRGGASKDTFVFDSGQDVIEDFNADLLRLDDALWGNTSLSRAQILDFASVVAGDTVFDFGGGNTLTLENYTDIAGLETLISTF